MKILWLCNIVLPSIAEKIGAPAPHTGGWLTGLSKSLVKKSDVELAVCFPFSELTQGNICGMRYYTFSCKNNRLRFEAVLEDFKPDVVHVFGTEFSHTLQMVQACENRNMQNRTVISIQGLVSVCAKHYYAGLPARVVGAFSLRDFLKLNNIFLQKKVFEEKGKSEREALRRVKHIIGRTDWDRACTECINPSAEYHFCNETLRPPFYENKWSYALCEKHSIFVSQCSYPIKGFHKMLEALSDVIKTYPDAKLYTTGQDPNNLTAWQKLRQGYYGRYIGLLIKKYGLKNHVMFLGSLDEKAMCERYLKSNVFVCCSSIENSPNSVGEAMILGVPTVSSDVGGVSTMLTHGKEGFLYPFDAPYMLSYYIKKIFSDECLQRDLSVGAAAHAEQTHSSEINTDTLIGIYKKIIDASAVNL